MGICVQCRKAMCSDCITKIDGVNHCRACLERVVRAQAQSRTEAKGGVPPWLAISFGFAVVWGLSYMMIEVLMPGSSGP